MQDGCYSRNFDHQISYVRFWKNRPQGKAYITQEMRCGGALKAPLMSMELPATTSLDSLSSSMNVDLAHLKNRYMDSFAKVPENSSSIVRVGVCFGKFCFLSLDGDYLCELQPTSAPNQGFLLPLSPFQGFALIRLLSFQLLLCHPEWAASSCHVS